MKALALAAVGVILCATVAASAPLGPVQSFPSPAGAGSGEPRFTKLADGDLLMSWLEGGGTPRLRVATLRDGQWDAPRTVVAGKDLLVNGADFPGVRAVGGGAWIAYWLRKNGPDGYGVWIAASKDRGKTWSAPQRLHRDASPTEHGFVSVIPKGDGALAMWLDGHNFAAGGEESGADMALHAADVSAAGAVSRERVLDSRVCDCCQTAAVRTSKGGLLAYRDRGPTEIRDIGLMREGGKHGPLHRDGWQIDGCPVNGPALDASGDRVVAAWFTAPNEEAHVRVAFSRDGGTTFGAPVEVASSEALGRTGAGLLADGAVVIWTEMAGTQPRFVARVVRDGGAMDAPVEIARVSTPKWSGVPQVAVIGDRVYFAWTVSDKGKTTVRQASATTR